MIAPAPGSCSSSWLSRWWPLAVVFVLALAVRCGFVLHYGPILTNDSDLYLRMANDVLDGEGLGSPNRVLPVYPLFVAAVLAVWSSHWAIIWTQAVAGALTCAALAATCRRLFQSKLAVVLGLAVALYLPLAAWCVMVLRETLIGFLVAVTTYCLVRSLQERGSKWCWITGIAFTTTLFCQPTFFSFPLWGAAAFWIHRGSFKEAVQAIFPLLACSAVVVCLWAARNYMVTSRFIPLTGDHIGCYFYLGVMNVNQTESGALTPEQIRYLGVADDDPYNTYQGLVDHYVRGDLETRLRDGPQLLSRGLRLIRHEPGKYFRFTVKRLHRLWFKDLWVERTEEAYLNLRPLDRIRREHRPSGFLLVALIYGFGYSSVIGIAYFWRRTLGLLVPIITFISFHMWMNVETRYALAIHPHLLIFSILALVCLWLRFVRRKSSTEIRASVLQ